MSLESINQSAILIIIVLMLAVAIDMLLKWLAFGRLESIAIHLSSFITLYCLIENLKGNKDFFWNFIISLLILLILTVLHTFLRIKVAEEIDSKFDELLKDADPNLKDKIVAQKNIARYAIDIALSKKRVGKLKRRQRVIQSLKEIGFDKTGRILNEDAFLVSRRMRISMMILFTLLGFIAVLIPIIPFKRWF